VLEVFHALEDSRRGMARQVLVEGLGWPADGRLRPALLRGADDASAPAPAASGRTAAEELQAQLATLQLVRPGRSPKHAM
jgi:hypothetical protein